MITTARSGCSFRASAWTVRPSMPGIFRSAMRTEKGWARSRASAEGPSAACSTV